MSSLVSLKVRWRGRAHRSCFSTHSLKTERLSFEHSFFPTYIRAATLSWAAPWHTQCISPRMKKRIKKNKTFLSQTDRQLFQDVEVMLEVDLVIPMFEAAARKTLSALRQRGYKFGDADLHDDGCLACLHLSLFSASQLLKPDAQDNGVRH